jgi:hypothetical protein
MSSVGPLAGWIATAAVIASCGLGVPNAGGLPTHRDLDGYPAALLEATLVLEGSCLYADGVEGSGRWLPIWPSGYGLSGEVVVDGSTPVASVGARVKLGGGEYPDSEYDFLRTLMTQDVPAACRGDGYWLVSDVVP